MKHRWDNSAKYRKWTLERDRALERLHTRAQLQAADVAREMLTHVLLTAKAQFHGMKQGYPMSVDWFESGLKQHFATAHPKLLKIMNDMRTRAYLLSKASEAEIIAQHSKYPVNANVTKSDLHRIRQRPSMAGGHLYHRVSLYLDKLRRKITSYAQAAAMTAKDELDFAKDIYSALPKPRRVSVPRRILKPQLMEAQGVGPRGTKADVAIDNIDEDEWQSMLDDYMRDYVPQWRAPEYVIDRPPVTGTDTWYAWEFERDITNEFVQSVRDGEVEAAKENGITDFVWIAVVDDKTDKCCLWRDGLLVSEIEEQVADHEDDDEDCNQEGDGLVPPIHFNCRCRVVPATDDIPDKPDDGAKDFEDWLNS